MMLSVPGHCIDSKHQSTTGKHNIIHTSATPEQVIQVCATTNLRVELLLWEELQFFVDE